MKMNFAKKATALAMSVLFAVSMAGCGSSASTAKKVEVTSVEDLADLKIGVQTGTTGDSQASDAVNADSQMPVSYTHLDVYKRQAYTYEQARGAFGQPEKL